MGCDATLPRPEISSWFLNDGVCLLNYTSCEADSYRASSTTKYLPDSRVTFIISDILMNSRVDGSQIMTKKYISEV